MSEGLELAVIGLTVVFAFLAALVLAVQLLGWFFGKWGDRFPEGSDPGRREQPGLEAMRVAAAVAAIARMRRESVRKAGP